MGDKSNGKSNGKDTENIIHFSELEKRQKKIKKETAKEQKKREKLEEQYRRQYRVEQAMEANKQVNMARQSASGKVPLVNWDKIPPFTRIFVGIMLVIHVTLALTMDEAQRRDLFDILGFVPAYYSGAIPWAWNALIAPFTTALLHGSWMHILTNCVMMMAMGVFFERQFGVRITLIFFIFCLMCGNLVYFVLSPTSGTAVIGASGAISGLFGAAILMMHASGMMGPAAQKRSPLPFILLWIAIMIGVGLVSADTAWQSHLGGFLGGIALFHLWRKGKISF